jgi:hypothetical protein
MSVSRQCSTECAYAQPMQPFEQGPILSEMLMPAHIKTSLPVGVDEHFGKPLHKTSIFFGTKDQIFVAVLRSYLLCFKTDM